MAADPTSSKSTRIPAAENLQLLPKQILRETVAYAHSRGMRVSGHVPAFMRASEVVERGFDEVQHIN